MSENVLKVRLQSAYKTEASWQSQNPVLKLGELAFSSDKTGLYKIGDGKSTWTQLSYITFPWSSISGRPSTMANPNSLSIKLNGGITEGSNLFTYTGSAAKTINITPLSISALPLSGGAMTGNISYTLYSSTQVPLKVYGGDENGQGISIGAGAATIVGSGESAKALESIVNATTEELILASDGVITFYTNCQNINDRVGVILGTARQFYPNANNTGSIGTSSNKWANIYATTIHGALDGNANTASKWATARTLTLTGAVTGSVNIDGSGNVSLVTTVNHSHNYAGSSSAGGNANAAVKLATARSINGTNFDGSGNITTANWGTARNITIGNTAKSVNGSGNVSWSLSEIGAAAASHTHSYLPLSGGTMSGTINSSEISNTYLAGNQGVAIINSTASAGSYVMLAKMNSTNGYFTQGTYQGTYLLQYTTKTNVDAGNNSVTKSVTLLNESGDSSFPGKVTASSFSGPLSGNSSTATKLQTARTINGTNFDGSANITTSNWGTARTITIGSTGKSVNGSANVSWSLSEIGAAASNHSHPYMPFTGSIITNPNASNFSLSNTMSGYLLFGNTGDTTGVALGIGGVNGGSDGWTVRGYQTANNKGCLEIAVGDDGDEGIYVRQYTSGSYKLPFMNKAGAGSGLSYREIVLMEPSTGNSTFPGKVNAQSFSVNSKVNLSYDSVNECLNFTFA